MRKTLSVVITAHREGLLLTPALRSASRAIAHLRAHTAWEAEAIVVLDKPDEPTMAAAQAWDEANVQRLRVDNGDPGTSRNDAVRLSSGELVAFLDGDDLWGANWLTETVRAQEFESRNVVWHPEVCVYFGLEPHVFRHIDMESREFDPLSLALVNCWTALSAARRQFLIDTPFAETKGVGFEDWDWNIAAIEQGALHKVVAGTGHAIRQRRRSRVKQASAAGLGLGKTTLFRNMLESRRLRSLNGMAGDRLPKDPSRTNG